MAVYFDAQSFKDITSTDSFTHTPVGKPRGVAVMIAQNASSSDLISGVTYGGVAMARASVGGSNGFANDTLTEPGAVYWYFLGSGIPTGPQTVAVTVSSGTDAKTVWCMSVTGNGDTEIVDSQELNENQTNPSMTLSTPPGYQGVIGCVFYSGLAAPSDANIAPASGYTKLTGTDTGGKDFGASCACAVYAEKTGANVVCSFTSGGDDAALVCAAIRESILPTTFNNYQHIDAGNGISVTEKIR